MIGYVLVYSVKNTTSHYVEKKIFNEESEANELVIRLCARSNVVGISLSKINYEIIDVSTIRSKLKNGK